MKKKKKQDKDPSLIEKTTSVKTLFKSIYKHDVKITQKNGKCKNEIMFYDVIENAMLRTNQIVTYSYQFIKLYILELYDKNEKIPDIDHKFIKNVIDIF